MHALQWYFMVSCLFILMHTINIDKIMLIQYFNYKWSDHKVIFFLIRYIINISNSDWNHLYYSNKWAPRKIQGLVLSMGAFGNQIHVELSLQIPVDPKFQHLGADENPLGYFVFWCLPLLLPSVNPQKSSIWRSDGGRFSGDPRRCGSADPHHYGIHSVTKRSL